MANCDSTRRSFFCREWVFEKIESCLDRRRKDEDYKSKGVIIVGGPGAGKTSVLSEIVNPRTKDGLQSELCEKVVAQHFCRANNTNSLSISEFIRGLCEQLSQSKSLESLGYREKLCDPQIKKYLSTVECARNPDVAFKEGILLPLNSLKAPGETFLVVIDSIDESCLHSIDDESSRVGVSRSIAELVATHIELFPAWLLVVLSSRKQSKTVVKMFTGFRKLTLDDLRKSYVVRDIQHYILKRLDREPELRMHLTRETAEIFNQLHIKSSGCFLYLEKVLDGVIAGIFSLEEVADIPGTLNGLYLWLCNRVYPEGQFDKIRPTLDVMLASQTPLKESEIFEVVWTRNSSLTSRDFQDIISMMGHILVDQNGAKAIFHHSFAEWLIDIKHCTSKYLCNPANGHAMLALRGTYLSKQGNLHDSVDFAFHLRRAFPKTELSEEHLALWLLWSNVPISDSLLTLDISQQEAVELLIRAGADVNLCDSQGQSALNCIQESEESIKGLLQKGAPVDQVDNQGRSLLANAAFNGKTDIVRLLLKHGANINQVDQCGQSALMLAARQGQSEIVYLLVNCGALVNHNADDGCTALRVAASCGYSDVVSVLLDHGANVDQADDDQRTALRGAAWGGHGDIVLQLLQHGANPNCVDKDGRTALIAASYMGHKKVVQILLDNKADVNHADNDGRTALSVAVLCAASSESHQEVIEILLEQGANVDLPDYDGMTPLCVACLEGHPNIVQLLLDAGADIGHWDRNGRTPLFAAASGGHPVIIDMLLSKKDDLQNGHDTWATPKYAMFKADHNGWTPLMVAAYQGHNEVVTSLASSIFSVHDVDIDGKTALILAAQGGHADVVSTLIDFGADTEKESKDGRTVIFEAALEGHENVISILVGHGANLDHRDALGRSPLFTVALERNKNIAKLLLDFGASVDCEDNEGRSPLHGVAWQGSYEMVELFIDKGADVNFVDNLARTALMSAAWQGHSLVVQLMINKGADVNMKSTEGATALCIATQEGHEEVVQLLLENGAETNVIDSFGRTPMQVAADAGHTKVSKMLEAFSVMKMSEGKFTSTLQKKLQDQSEQSDGLSSVSSSSGPRKLSESMSSSTSSSSIALERQDNLVENDTTVVAPSPLQGHRECRYSASFTEVFGVKDVWNECPPYECPSEQPPPYSETPENYGIHVADDVVVNQPNATRRKRRPMTVLEKMRSSFRPASSGAQGKDKKNKGEKRRLFGLRKASVDRRSSSRERAASFEDTVETVV